MKEIIIWLLVICGISVSVYQVDKANKAHKEKQAQELKKQMGESNTDCVLMPESPACKGKNK